MTTFPLTINHALSPNDQRRLIELLIYLDEQQGVLKEQIKDLPDEQVIPSDAAARVLQDRLRDMDTTRSEIAILLGSLNNPTEVRVRELLGSRFAMQR